MLGLYARLYATRFPDEVAGLVLMEPDHEDYDDYMPRQLTQMRGAWDPDQELPDRLPDEAVQLYRGLFAHMMANWPRGIREPLIERHVSRERIMDGYRVVPYRDRFLDEMRHAGPLPDVPLIVLTAMDIDDFKKAVLIGESESLLREETASDGSTTRWPHRCHAVRTARSTAPDTPLFTGAVPTPGSTRSRTYSAGEHGSDRNSRLLISAPWSAWRPDTQRWR